MYKPASTYRIQFNKDFNFASFDKIIPYLKKLGVQTIYASPIFAAIPGSTHGYDVVNPLQINPEIGTEAELLKISKRLKKAGIGWLQDIVPNHMSFHPNNLWLMDVLKNGKNSKYYKVFDLILPDDGDRLIVPFLGEPLDEAIANFKISIKKIEHEFFITYGENKWPICENSTTKLHKKQLKHINQNSEELKQILDEQFYILCDYLTTEKQINYRRFFTVNSLICLNVQDEEVFNIYHQYILELVKKGIFQGLRIDHIDGLYDPEAYLKRLRNHAGEETYIVAEKILAKGETFTLKPNFQGTTGYDFLAMANNLFTSKAAKLPFESLYQEVTGKELNSDKLIYDKKSAILLNHMHGELDNLVKLFLSLELVNKDVSAQKIKKAIAALLIAMPVYRFYDYSFPLMQQEAEKLNQVINSITDREELKEEGLLLRQVFLNNPKVQNELINQNTSRFYQRLMQFTGPLMAKGVEDTTMFTYNRLSAHSEVGDAPDAFGVSVNTFHHFMQERQQINPFSMNATATHDTKRGEDVRSRLNTITEVPAYWVKFIKEVWEYVERSNNKYPTFKSLHPNDVYLFLQTLVGVIPFPETEADDLNQRFQNYIEKALREAKKRSDWTTPDEDYETAMKDFFTAFINDCQNKGNPLYQMLIKIADASILNSLSQVALKFCCPGIPDVYQGTELWDLSLVDPDNRRPVNFKKRKSYLKAIDSSLSINSLWENRFSGSIKLWLTKELMNFRKKEKSIFESGEYIPLHVEGSLKEHVLAFARKLDAEWLLVAIPLGLNELIQNQGKAVNHINWEDTRLIIPQSTPVNFTNILTGKAASKDFLDQSLAIKDLFKDFPLAIIKSESKQSDRKAGILMHVTSLPSRFGIGDMGKEAFKFIDFLVAGKQAYWQILPLTPTKAENGHSPYSSNSAMAGNVLLISPEELINDELLTQEDLQDYELPVSDKIDFTKTEQRKKEILKRAYQNYLNDKPALLEEAFELFQKKEDYWLNDFALYVAIKNANDGLESYSWPDLLRLKDANTLSDFAKNNNKEIQEIKWQQFIFFKQWSKLQHYARVKRVGLIGDLPFYLDYDSVEVWSNPNYFKLDDDLKRKKVAGVPPDYFSENGQLWGMPVYNWKLMKKEDYSWWQMRLKRNMELYDLIRIDHFRAFASFWEVDAGERTAINGEWKKGPGAKFFKTVKKELKKLPFIAEDLGEIDPAVEQLRTKFDLPGMKVIQFAFGEQMIDSVHIPHNYNDSNTVVYSGSHDNNTLKGWFLDDINDATKKRIEAYIGSSITEFNVNKHIQICCYSSNAKLVIMPVQDVLALGTEARMNVPGHGEGNWLWRLSPNALTSELADQLAKQAEIFGRSV